MVLVISNKFDPHVDLLIPKLVKRHIPFARFNTEDFPLRSTLAISLNSQGYRESMQLPNSPILSGREVTSVWYRRPARYEFPAAFSPRAEVLAERETTTAIRGMWSLLDCLWVNHPDKNRAAEVKISQLKKAIKLGLEIPETVVTNDPSVAQEFIQQPDQVVIKTLSGGMVPNDPSPEVIFTNIIKDNDLSEISNVRFAPVLLQKYVPKSVEIRTTIIGEEMFSAEIHSQVDDHTRHDWRRRTLSLKHLEHRLPPEIGQKCLALVGSFGLNFGAIDLILTPDGRYVFLELNPNGQWAWIELTTGLPLSEAMINLLTRNRHG